MMGMPTEGIDGDMGVVALPRPPPFRRRREGEEGRWRRRGRGRRGRRSRPVGIIIVRCLRGGPGEHGSQPQPRQALLLLPLLGGSRGAVLRPGLPSALSPSERPTPARAKGVVLFNDGPFEDVEVLSDGDDLSGNDETSVSDDSSDDYRNNGDDGGGEGEKVRDV
jgi:hypothetical protein